MTEQSTRDNGSFSKSRIVINYQAVSLNNSSDNFDRFLGHESNATTALEHLTGLMKMLEFISDDTSGFSTAYITRRYYELVSALNQVGQLGAAIADHAYGEVSEMFGCAHTALNSERNREEAGRHRTPAEQKKIDDAVKNMSTTINKQTTKGAPKK